MALSQARPLAGETAGRRGRWPARLSGSAGAYPPGLRHRL